MEDLDLGVVLGVFAGLLIALLVWVGYQAYEDSQHFTLYYDGTPYNPTCHGGVVTGVWDCEHI